MGMGPIHTALTNVQQDMLAEQQRQWQQQLASAATQPIPGFTGPATNTGGIPGMLPGGPPPPQQIPSPQAPGSPFMAVGPYGQQAQRMAGLLGQVAIPQQPTAGYQGLLGGPKGGFRIPSGK